MKNRGTAHPLTAAICGTLVLALLLSMPAPGRADSETALWAALGNGDHVALLRHAHAPGTDAPPGFRLEDCSTQRNLSETGREQARAIGARFRTHQVNITALSGVSPQSGQIVVVRPDGDDIVVLGRIR